MTSSVPSPGAPTPPDGGHQHRWTPWSRVGYVFDWQGAYVGCFVIQVSPTPSTLVFSRQCMCGQIEVSR